MNLDPDVATPIPMVPIHPPKISKEGGGPVLSKAEQRRIRNEGGSVYHGCKYTKEEVDENRQELKDRRKVRRALGKGSAGRKREVARAAKREREDHPVADVAYLPSAMAVGEVSKAKRRKV